MSHHPGIGVIADDLTGAAEIGAIGLRYGLSAEVIIRGETAHASSETGLVCIDSDSRSSRSDQATLLARRSAAALEQLNPSWIYKKTDSVLRGNVIAEIEAIAAQLKLRRSLLVPANPSFGRVIQNGIYYVKGKPIAETDFARDPEHPRLSSEVRSMLGERGKLVRVVKPGETVPESGIALGEVSSPTDVEHWARQRSPDLLCAGGAEFFTALLERSGYAVSHNEQQDQGLSAGDRRELFVCGSISDTTQTFVRQSQASGVPVFFLPHGIPAVEKARRLKKISEEVTGSLQKHHRVILSVQPPTIPDRETARQFSIDLVDIARIILAGGGLRSVCAEGGATAAALVRAMGWDRLAVVREVAPGVATLRPRESNLLLTVKPGSYPGWLL